MKEKRCNHIGYLIERNEMLQEKLDQMTGSQVYQRLMMLENSEKELLNHVQREKQARRDLLKDVEQLEQEKSRLQRKTERFNLILEELEVVRRFNGSLQSQLEAAWKEIEEQENSYLKVI